MINQNDIDEAVQYGTKRNLDKEARELTERYLLDKLGEFIALKKSKEDIDKNTDQHVFTISLKGLQSYLCSATTLRVCYNYNALCRILNAVSKDAKENGIKIRYAHTPKKGKIIVLITKTQ